MRFCHTLAVMQQSDAVELAVASDESGYDGIVIPDISFTRASQLALPVFGGHPGFDEDKPWPDPWVLIGMAAKTKRIRFSTNAYTIAAEVGDFARWGSITKAGNAPVRRVLMETSWAYRHRRKQRSRAGNLEI